jgi:hypothetical protein
MCWLQVGFVSTYCNALCEAVCVSDRRAYPLSSRIERPDKQITRKQTRCFVAILQSNWKAKYSLPYHLLTDEGGELLKAFGAAKGAKSVLRSHVIIAKGGKLLVVANGIKPGDSFAQASEFCAANPQE